MQMAAPNNQQGSAVGPSGSATGFSTFAQMQKQGIPRPASPSYSPQQPVTTQPVANKPPVAQETPAQGGGASPAAPPPMMAPGGVQPIYTSNVPGMNQNGGTTPPPQTQLPPQQGPQAQNTNWGNTGQQLYQNWQQSQQTPAQQFVPGANPFQQGSFQYNNPLNQQLQQSVSQHLANPSAYNSQMVQGTYNMLNQDLSQGYDYQRKQLQDMMAQRGFDASTLHGQKYSDLGTEQARAQANLAYQLTTDAAKQYGNDLNGAISAAMGYGAQDFGQAQSAYNTNQSGQSQLYQQQLAAFQANQAAQQQQYGQQQQNFQNYVGFGQQDFNNQMDVNQFNASRDDAMNQYLLALMGGIGG